MKFILEVEDINGYTSLNHTWGYILSDVDKKLIDDGFPVTEAAPSAVRGNQILAGLGLLNKLPLPGEKAEIVDESKSPLMIIDQRENKGI
jgi:hypothetical protein